MIAFNHEPRPLTEWTQAPEVVRRAMSGLRPFGATALYDAVLTTLPIMDTRTKQRGSVLIISDGADTASDAALREVRSALVRSDAFVYAIAIDPPARRAINETVDVTALNEITGGSGGNTELVHETAGLVAATARIAEELNSQYVLGYHSPQPPDGKYRSIRVRATSPDYRVRARRGYIADARSRSALSRCRSAYGLTPRPAICAAMSGRKAVAAAMSASPPRISPCMRLMRPRPYSATTELGFTTSACA